MKTLIITLEYPPQIGGIASYIYNFALHSKPEEIVIYAPKMAGDKGFDVQAPWKTYRGQPYWAFVWPHWLRLLWQTRNIVKLEKIEAIHLHHVLPVGHVARIIKKLYHIPFIVFLHGTDLELAVKNRRKAKKLLKICQGAQTVVFNSEFTRRKFISRFENFESRNLKVVYPCPGDLFLEKVADDKINKLKAQLALQGKKVILTVARLAEGKGYPHLIRLLPQVLQKIPNLVWLIIGDGPKKTSVIKSIQDNNLQNVVRFIGQISYNELPVYYQLADLFVLLTHKDEQTEEGWGTVFLEAAASGLPVVAGRVGGVEEVVENLRTGLLVDTYQDMSVVSAVAELLRQDEYAQQMGTAGRERVRAEFNWDKQIQKLYV